MAPMTNLILGVLDHVSELIPTGTERNASTALENLTNEFPQHLWIPAAASDATAPPTGVDRPFFGAEFHKTIIDVDLLEPRSIGYAFLGNLNATPAFEARVRISSTAITARENVIPNVLTNTILMTGDETDIDDDPSFTLDGNFVESTSDAGSKFLAQMATPSGTPVTGPDLQIARCIFTAPPEGAASIDSISIREGGVLKEECTLSATSVAAGKTVCIYGTWDAASLDTADGSAAQIQVLWSGGQPTDGDVRIEAMDWFCLHTAADYEGPFSEAIPDAMAGATLADQSIEDTTLMLTWGDSINPDRVAALPAVDLGTYEPVTGARFLSFELLDPHTPDPNGLHAGLLKAGPAMYFDSSTGSAQHGWTKTLLPPMPDHHVRQIGIPLRILSPTRSTELMAYAVAGSRSQQVYVHLEPDLTDAERTVYHLPMVMRFTGNVGLTEILASLSSDDGTIQLVEDWGDR